MPPITQILESAFSGDSTAGADITRSRAAEGETLGSSAFAGSLVVNHSLQSTIVGESTFTGLFEADLKSALNGKSSFDGTLDVKRYRLFQNQTGSLLQVRFPEDVRVDGITDPESYRLQTFGAAYPISISGITPVYDVFGTGYGEARQNVTPLLVGTFTINQTAWTEVGGLWLDPSLFPGGTLVLRARLVASASSAVYLRLIRGDVLRPVDSSYLGSDQPGERVASTQLTLGEGWHDFRPDLTYYRIELRSETGGDVSCLGLEIDNLWDDPRLFQGADVLPAGLVAGDYIELLSGSNVGQYRIDEILAPNRVRLDAPLTSANGLTPYRATSGVLGVDITTTKVTNGHTYEGSVRVTGKNGEPKVYSGEWQAVADRPRVGTATNPEDGTLILDFGEPMRFDADLTRPTEYKVTGSTVVDVVGVRPVSPTAVALQLQGLEQGFYLLTVNATGTPHDIAGNPIDPAFNTAAFTGSLPLTARSIYTDKGPIARPPLTIREGTTATLLNFTDVQLSAGTMANDVVGRYLKITGTGKNDGDYFVTKVLTSNRVRVKASFSLPDTTATAWAIYDPRDGQIADDPAHVTVKINGVPTQPEAVIGLLGQIVMPVAPAPTDDVKVGYSWVPNPTVDVARINSREFRFNNWNRDLGRPADTSGHKYRFNNVLAQSSSYQTSKTVQQGTGVTVNALGQATLASANLLPSFVGLTLRLTKLVLGIPVLSYYRIATVLGTTTVGISPATLVGTYVSWEVLDQTSVVQATLDQPYNRELHYRAYERAYTPIFNDPNLLVFNTPNHHIAYPPLERRLVSSFVSYEPTSLPDTYPDTPWTRLPPTGTGLATLVADELVVEDLTSGPFPSGDPIFWRRSLDLTFEHVFALAWRMYLNAVPTYNGVFSGVAAGYSTDKRVILIGYLEEMGVKKFGILRSGYGDNPSDPNAWIGGIDALGNATLKPVPLDWTVLRSYRLYRSKDGVVRVFLDGEVVETLRVYEEDLPFLEELAAPFDTMQQVFFGSTSREAANRSTWDFVRYQVLPLDASQSEPSIFVSYEANLPPEVSPNPWTPVGYHGTETIQGTNYLLLESTSATDIPTEGKAGLIGGDFRGFMRIEPLLSASSDVVLDVNLRGLYQTHGVSPNALMAAISDGDRLTQLSFLTKKEAPKLGYGGRSLPSQWTPTPWSSMGGASAEMVGRVLRITDATIADGLIYYREDTASPIPPGDDARVVSATADYAFEFRCQVRTYTVDGAGFAGASADVYDGTRDLGILLIEVGGVRKVALHSDGTVLVAYPFNWYDGKPHTYRIVKDTAHDLVSLFIDFDYTGSQPYSSFTVSGGGPTGVLMFGSSTAASKGARSVVDWSYANAWRIWSDQKYYVGLWRGTVSGDPLAYPWDIRSSGLTGAINDYTLTDPVADFSLVQPGDPLLIDTGFNRGVYEVAAVPSATSLVISATTPLAVQPDTVAYRLPVPTEWSLWRSSLSSTLADFHLPLKTLGEQAAVNGNVLTDLLAMFVTDSVVMGDQLIVESGPNRGVYEIQAVISQTQLAVVGATPFPAAPSVVNYRIPREMDWTSYHRYRIARTPAGEVAVIRDGDVDPFIRVDYSNADLPSFTVGVPYIVAAGVPSIVWGAFDSSNLSSSSWDYVRYGVTRSPSELRIVPHHQVMNQRNVIASPEHLRANIPHPHTDFWSSSTGIPPQTEPDVMRNSALLAYTQLNDGTPLVPSTQTSEVRVPTPVREFVSAFNRPEDNLNTDGDFKLNDGATRWRLIVPDDVLYNSLEVIEQTTGTEGIIAPFDDATAPISYGVEWQKEVCLKYTGDQLPENAPHQPTPWVLAADNLSHVDATAFSGVLTFGTDVIGTRAIYRNATPLPDSPSLSTAITFRMKVLSDTTLGLGDTQVRLGFSAIGMTLALAFRSLPSGHRYVIVLDLNSGTVLGGILFDYLDGATHTYRLVREPGRNNVSVAVVS